MNKSKLLQVLTISLLIILIGCNSHHSQLQRLNHLDSLMEEHPNEVYDTLCKMASAIKKENTGKDKMKYRVLMAKVRNKLYLEMPSDSSFQEVVDYYDKNGTPNERMEAHYLMGCIYRDKKEAPMAMQCYQEAVECADTLSKDCDYVTLFSIYGQMADVFRDQFLHKNAIEAFLKYSEFALKAHNLHHYVLGKELMISEYYQMGDTAKAFALTRESSQLYLKYNMPKKAASVFPTIISYYLKNKRYDMARKYLDIMESQSIVYDKNRKIVKGYEYNINYKGIYLLGVGKIDSAELCFRYLNSSKYKFEAAKGLLAVYRIRHNLDSIVKYSMACENGLDTILADVQTASVAQTSSMYDYNRFKGIAQEKEVKLKRTYLIIMLLGGIVGSIVLSFCLIVRKRKKINEKIKNDYIEALVSLNIAREELVTLKADRETAILKQQDKIKNLLTQIDEYENGSSKVKTFKKHQELLGLAIVDVFRKKASPKASTHRPVEKDWKELVEEIAKFFPLLIIKLTQKNLLATQEFRVCILCLLGFSNSEISILLNTSSQRVTNAKSDANMKLFGQKGASTLYKNLLKL